MLNDVDCIEVLMVLIIDVIVGSKELFSSHSSISLVAQCAMCSSLWDISRSTQFCIHIFAAYTCAPFFYSQNHEKKTYTNNIHQLHTEFDRWMDENFVKRVYLRSQLLMWWECFDLRLWVNLKLIASYITITISEFILTCVWCVT